MSTWVEVFSNIQHLGPYIGTILPVACTSAVGTLMCWSTAKDNGDTFNLRETMLVDATGTMIAALFGCPFGTTVYLGHSAYKKVNARSAYSLINASTFFVLAITGLFAVIRAIIPIQAVAPLIVYVGVGIGTDAIQGVPFRHVTPILFGLMPGFADWADTVCPSSEAQERHPGLRALGTGSLLVSMILTAALALITDRNFFMAACWALAGAIASLFGFIHAQSVGTNFDDGTRVSPWRLATGYAMVGAVLVLTGVCQRWRPAWVDEPISGKGSHITIGELISQAQTPLKLQSSRVRASQGAVDLIDDGADTFGADASSPLPDGEAGTRDGSLENNGMIHEHQTQSQRAL